MLFVNFRDDDVVTLPNGWMCLTATSLARAQHTNERMGSAARGMYTADLKLLCKKSARVSNARAEEAETGRPKGLAGQPAQPNWLLQIQ